MSDNNTINQNDELVKKIKDLEEKLAKQKASQKLAQAKYFKSDKGKKAIAKANKKRYKPTGRPRGRPRKCMSKQPMLIKA